MEEYTKRIFVLKSKIIKEIKQFQWMIKPCTYMFLLYSFSITAIIGADFRFGDDAGRVFSGFKKWDNEGRFVSNWLSNVLHSDSYLTDISPLSQYIATSFLAIASVTLLWIVLHKKEFRFIELISALTLGINPYFLTCLAYKYDSPYMALSILVSVIPLLFYTKRIYPFIVSLGGL